MRTRTMLDKLVVLMALVVVIDLIFALAAYAQGGTVPATPGWGDLLKSFSVSSIVTLLWGLVGPTLTVAITATVNSLIKGYVPREIQIPLAGIISAVLAGVTGDNSVQAAGIGFAEGMSIQSALSMNPQKFLASAPPK